jgi:hypothetical protein
MGQMKRSTQYTRGTKGARSGVDTADLALYLDCVYRIKV